MIAFRILLAIMITGLLGYTGVVGANHGWNLFPVLFGDMAAMTWPGQFNFDFMCLLIFSGLWVAWRHHFSPGGLVLGVLGVFGGTMMLAPYLLIMSFKAKGDMKEILLGTARASRDDQ
jgi:hypothetical protein